MTNKEKFIKSLHEYEIESPHYQPIDRSKDDGRQEMGSLKIMCVGDILCEEKLYNAYCFNGKFNFHNIYTYVRPLITKADLAICNLETTICESSPYTGESYKVDGKFHNNAPIEFLDAIQDAGFEFLITANNHCTDSGVDGAMETLMHIEERGMRHTGIFRPDEEKHYSIVERNGIKLAILAYTTWFNRNEGRFTKLAFDKIFNGYSNEKVKRDISEARKDGAEFVIVYMHWGTDCEYKNQHTDRMSKMAQEVAEAGADYIVGSHPHAVQEYERIFTKDKRWVPCAFSLGNYVTSEISMVSRENVMLSITLKKNEGKIEIANEEFIPCYVPNMLSNISYPIVPEKQYNTFTAGMSDSISNAYAKIKGDLGGELETEKQFLTKRRICAILGIPFVPENQEYTSINFAQDARSGGVAIVSAITSNPTYITPKDKCIALADEAIKKGAKLLISTEQIGSYPCLIVDNVFSAYCKLVSSARNRFNPRTIAITGSIGKTSTTEMVYTLISSKYNTHRNTGSANSVRYSGSVIQQLKSEHEFYVQEVMEGPPFGAASTISKMVKPQAAIVTMVGTSHMEEFGSQERILESCLGIQDGMGEDGLLILNGDDPFQRDAKCGKEVVYYGIDNENADYRAVNIHGEGMCLHFDVLHHGRSTAVRIHCFGRHNVLNALAVFAAGKWADMSDDEIVRGLDQYRTSGIRQNLVKYGGYYLYLDCYNAAPESMQSAFDAFGMIEVPKGGRRIAVLADIKESGTKEKEFHIQVGEMVNSSSIDELICYGEASKYMAETVEAAGRIPVHYTNDFNTLIDCIRDTVTEQDVTLFKGSHGMELEHAVDTIWGTWLHEEFERYDFKTREYKDENFKYRVYTDHVSLVSKQSTAEVADIPSIVEGLPVTSISSSAFNGTKYTKKVMLPNQLKNIRYCAFYKADKIEEIVIPPSVLIIDRSAFSTCPKLKKVVIEDGCKHIGYRAFGNCPKLEYISIPESVHQIEGEAFLNCKKLKIYGKKGSYAYKYAKERKIEFCEI